MKGTLIRGSGCVSCGIRELVLIHSMIKATGQINSMAVGSMNALSLTLFYSLVMPASCALTSDSVVVPASCALASDSRSDLGCTSQINSALAAIGSRTGGGRVLLEAGRTYPIVCPLTSEASQAHPAAHLPSWSPSVPPSALTLTGGHDLVLGSTSSRAVATLLVDFTPAPCTMLTLLNTSNITVQDLAFDALRPSETLAQMRAVAPNSASFTAWVPPPTSMANTSFAGLTSGSQSWLGAVETVQPVEWVEGADTWQFTIPNSQAETALVIHVAPPSEM